MGTLWQDLRYGVRMLARKPGFTVIAVLTLALGTGANTAIFSVVNAVLLRPLPYPEPERLMQIGRSFSSDDVNAATEAQFLFWQEHNQSFEAMASFKGIGSGVNISGGNEPEYVDGLRVSAGFFRVLGVSPAVGRSFTKEEDRPGGEPVAILSDGLWRRRFGADAGLLGKAISLNSENYTVIGIMPPDFRFIPSEELFVPLRTVPGIQQSGYNYPVLGRLKPGVTREQALADMKRVAEEFRAEYPKQVRWRDETVNVLPYQERLVGDLRPSLLMLLGAVTFVLLIACANVANLQLARSAARQKEMAIRMALGANWRRIMRQLLTEGVLLSLAGGVAGLLLAAWGVDLLRSLIPEGMIPRAAEVGFDLRVLVFTFATAIITGLVFGLAPAVQAARVDVNHSLKEGSRKGAAGAGRGRLRNLLVVAEIALSLVLLVGAALMIRTFANLRHVEPGFDPHNILTFQVSLSGQKYDATAKVSEFYRRALESLKSLPGVEAAAVTSNLPLDRFLNLPAEIEGKPEIFSVEYRMITPEFFRVMKMALGQGRAFDETDTEGSEQVVIVNEAFAHQYFPNVNPIGQRMIISRSLGPEYADRTPRQIVGLVGDVKQFSLGTPAPPIVFVPVTQVPSALMLNVRQYVATNFVLRTAGDPLSLSASVKKEMLGLDPTLPVKNVRSMEQVLSKSIAHERFHMSLLGLFAGTGLVLAAVGIYGVISYSVMQRTHEMGIRIALGARGSDVLKLVVGQGMVLVLIGVSLGLGVAFAVTRVMVGLLYGVSATDPVTFIAISLLLSVVALLACYIPARRATRVDPMVALRYE